MARRSNPKPFKRTDRIGELVREIVASELERIGDDRLELVTVTAARVDRALASAEVFYSAMLAEADGRLDEVEEALDDVRWPIQQVINRQVRARRTPQIRFLPDRQIFRENAEYSFDILSQRLRELSFLNRGVEIVIIDERGEGRRHDFKYEGGIRSFVEHLNRNKSPLHRPPMHFQAMGNDGIEVEIAQNVKIHVVKSAITQVMSKTEPAVKMTPDV